jgi:hypothetical protein
LQVTYVPPKFPVEPKTQIEALLMENKLLDSGDRESYKKLYGHLSDSDINRLLAKRRKDKEEQVMFEADLEVKKGKLMQENGLDPLGKAEGKKPEGKEVDKVDIDNKMKHSTDSSLNQKK